MRRFVKPEHLPDHLSNDLAISPTGQQGEASQGQNGEGEENLHDKVVATAPSRPTLHLLVCAVTDLNQGHVEALLAFDDIFDPGDVHPPISIITVPGIPPASEAQAKRWSQEYWPTIYKGHNPYGAQPALISRAVSELEEGGADEQMHLARKVGKEASTACIGEDVGVAVVERNETGNVAVVMVAGDARWDLSGQPIAQEGDNGNAMAHAVMRAIGLIAKKRQPTSAGAPTTNNSGSDAFVDHPLTPLEKEAYAKSSIDPAGYLCLGLEFYLTHEPCVMCSMALVHSRVSRVIFEKRMPLTGGLTAGSGECQDGDSPGLGYGLFWLPSLNWKFLTWQWMLDDPEYPSHSGNEKMHA